MVSYACHVLSIFTPTPWSGQWFPIWKHVQWQPAVYAIEYGTVKLLPRDKTSGPGNQVTKNHLAYSTTKGALPPQTKMNQYPKPPENLATHRVNQPESYGKWALGPGPLLNPMRRKSDPKILEMELLVVSLCCCKLTNRRLKNPPLWYLPGRIGELLVSGRVHNFRFYNIISQETSDGTGPSNGPQVTGAIGYSCLGVRSVGAVRGLSFFFCKVWYGFKPPPGTWNNNYTTWKKDRPTPISLGLS